MKRTNDNVAVFHMEDGKTTCLITAGVDKVSKGSVICSAHDVYNEHLGMMLSLAKALGDDPLSLAAAMTEALSKTKAPDAAKVVVKRAKVKDLKGVPAGKVRRTDGRLVLECKALGDKLYGVPGKGTRLKDCNGKVLMVGDLVTVDLLDRNGKVSDSMKSMTYVVEDEDGAFILGIKDACDLRDGHIDSSYRVRLAKKWAEVEVGETHHCITLTWREGGNR